MEINPRCNKCHRRLTNPLSIAAGMGPQCRGGRGAGRRSRNLGPKSRRERGYEAVGESSLQFPLAVFTGREAGPTEEALQIVLDGNRPGGPRPAEGIHGH